MKGTAAVLAACDSLSKVSDGHFVQFFAPEKLDPLPKNIVFVIDVSGSMWGLKMRQVRLSQQLVKYQFCVAL